MIVGIGVDIIENARMKRELERHLWEAGRDVFTLIEIQKCGSGTAAATRYASCFAAKEATLKALGMAVADIGVLREVEVMLERNGRHAIALQARTEKEACRLGVKRIWVSIASTRQHSSAMVVLES